jgi:cytochrome b561
MTNTIYSQPLRVLHWLMAILVITVMVLGLTMGDFPKLLRPDAYDLHKWLGLTVGFLLIARVAARIFSSIPAMPASYALMLLMPLSGYLMRGARGHDVMWFGIALPPLPGLYPEMARFAHTVHVWLPNFFIAVMVLHVAAVLKHWFVDHENLLKRMR